ncbi:hypothetical protein D9M70_553440 [compost metagenome]
MQALGDHAMHAAAGGQRGIGHYAHQALGGAAIDQGDSRLSQCLAQRPRAVGEVLGGAQVRSAEDGYGLDVTLCHWIGTPSETGK